MPPALAGWFFTTSPPVIISFSNVHLLILFLVSISFSSAVFKVVGTRDHFLGRKLFRGPGSGGWFGDDSGTLH